MGRESSSRTKELFNLHSYFVNARHLGGSAICKFYKLGESEQLLCGIPLGFGIIVEDKSSELSCTCTCMSKASQISQLKPNTN